MYSMVPVGKTPLRINMDETSVCLFQGLGKGIVFIDKKRSPPVQLVATSKRRCCLTHVAFICDRPDIQQVLPQVLIGNETTLPARRLAALRAASPRNVWILRQKSAWSNQFTCAWIMELLAAALAPFTATVQPILLFDAVRIHITRLVLAACVRSGIWPILVPARVTWLLQPLDVAVFFGYKLRLRKAYRRARAASPTGDIDISEFLPCVYDAIEHAMEHRPWADAFDRTGFNRRQSSVSDTVRRYLALEGPANAGASWPTLDQLRSCFPRRAVVPQALLYRPFLPVAVVAPAGVPFVAGMGVAAMPRVARVPAAAAMPAPDVPRLRTRGDHRRAAAARH